MKNKIAVYTAIFGGYDNLRAPEYLSVTNEDVDLICFTDDKGLVSDLFKIIVVERKFADPIRDARYFKIMSHQVLTEYKYTVWLDANMKIVTRSFTELINKYLLKNNLAIFKHSHRNCLYREAKWAAADLVDNPKIIRNQIKRYKKAGFPANFGLVASNIIFRRQSEKDIVEFNNMWWNEIMNGSRRDQLSFDYVRWKLKTPVTYLDEGSWFSNKIAILEPHLKKRAEFKHNLYGQFSFEHILYRLKQKIPNSIKRLYHRIEKS